MSNKIAIKKVQVDDAIRVLGNIPHLVNDNNTIAIPTPVGTVMLYPTSYKIQLGSEVRNLVFPYCQESITGFIDEMMNR